MMRIRVLFLVSMCLVVQSNSEELCGKPESSLEVGIRNGKFVPLHAYPWMAYLALVHYKRDGSLEGNTCGATLISNQWLLTSAHCLTVIEHESFLVGVAVLGTNNLMPNRMSKHAKQTSFGPNDVFINDQFNSETGANDIALVRLSEPLNIKKTKNYIQPICLPGIYESSSNSYVISKDDDCVATGWSKINPKLNNSGKLLQVTETVIEKNEDCKAKLPSVTEGQICASSLASTNPCNGDYGGPLQCRKKRFTLNDNPNNTKNPWTIVGIIPFGGGCDETSVFTNVTNYLPWIESILDSNMH